MNPLERYLSRVRARLPKNGRDDIIAELEEALRARLERREQEFGHKLSDAEADRALRDYGHPYLVAGRYWKGTGLINGPLSPYYWRTLLLGFLAIVIVQLYLAAAKEPASVAQFVSLAIPRIVTASVMAFMITTLVFLVLAGACSRVKWRVNRG